jgi:hypothetical protein
LDDYEIIQIKAACDGPLQFLGNTRTNHWVLHLVLSVGGSIRVDMSPAGTSNIGILVISYYEDEVSKFVAKVCDIPVVQQCSAKAIVELLQREHYDCYKFNEHGVGCRNWVDSVLVLLRRNQITTEDETEHARVTLRHAWNDEGTLLPAANQSGIDTGTFYGPGAHPLTNPDPTLFSADVPSTPSAPPPGEEDAKPIAVDACDGGNTAS